MWKIIERAMAVIGFIATVGGTIIAYYAFVQPADLSDNLAKVAERLSSEPVLSEQERIYVGQFVVIGNDYMIYIEKQLTKSTGEFTLQLCDSLSGQIIGEGKFSFGREATVMYPTFKGGPNSVNIVLSATVGEDRFARKEEWRNVNNNWSRSAPPKLVEGTSIPCK